MLGLKVRVSLVFGLIAATSSGEANAQFFRERVQPPAFRVLQFGMAMAASSDTLVVGAPDSIRNNSTANCSVAYSGFGAVMVYKKTGGSWTLNQELWHDTYPNTNTTNWEPRFGSAVSLKGNTLIVGAERLQSGTIAGAGAFYLFKRSSASAAFSRFGPFYDPTPVAGARLGESGGVATNGTYVAINKVGSVLYYRIQGNAVSFVASIPLPVWAPPEEMLVTDDNVLVTFIAGYTTLPAYQLGPTGYTTLDTSALSSDGAHYTRPAAGDGNTFVTGLNNDPNLFRVVDFSGGAVTAVTTQQVAPPAELETPFAHSVAIKQGAGIYAIFKETNGNGTALAEMLSSSYIPTSMTRPISTDFTVLGGTGVNPVAFNGDELFIGGTESGFPSGGCTSNFPSPGTVHSFVAGGLAKAVVSSILSSYLR